MLICCRLLREGGSETAATRFESFMTEYDPRSPMPVPENLQAMIRDIEVCGSPSCLRSASQTGLYQSSRTPPCRVSSCTSSTWSDVGDRMLHGRVATWRPAFLRTCSPREEALRCVAHPLASNVHHKLACHANRGIFAVSCMPVH